MAEGEDVWDWERGGGRYCVGEEGCRNLHVEVERIAFLPAETKRDPMVVDIRVIYTICVRWMRVRLYDEG